MAFIRDGDAFNRVLEQRPSVIAILFEASSHLFAQRSNLPAEIRPHGANVR